MSSESTLESVSPTAVELTPKEGKLIAAALAFTNAVLNRDVSNTALMEVLVLRPMFRELTGREADALNQKLNRVVGSEIISTPDIDD